MPKASPYTQAIRLAAEHMAHHGELRIVVGVGEFCRNPPPTGSGIIVSDLGRLQVSSLTVRKLRQIGLERRNHYEVAGKFEGVLRAIGNGRDILLLHAAA